MTALPPNMPAPVRATLSSLMYQGYRFDRLVRHPAYREPLARVYLTGPSWVLVFIGTRWLVAYCLFRCPVTSSIGASLIRYGFAQQPIRYIDAAGVAH